LCGGGCVVQKKQYPEMECKEHAVSVISEFVDLMKDKILEKSETKNIVPINDLWQ
jgi:hypothetical protein